MSVSRAEVRLARCDVAIQDHVSRFVKDCAPCFPEVGMVLHAAGVLADALLPKMARGHIERVTLPKVYGALHVSFAYTLLF